MREKLRPRRLTTLTRADLSDIVHNEAGLSRADSTRLVDSVFEQISDSLIADEKVKLAGFGNFFTRIKPARSGRNPNTGERLIIPARKIAIFKPSPKFLKRLSQSAKARIKVQSKTGADK